MVLKVGKCGVRSGNSIKVPNAKYLRHYRKESVLVRSHITNSEVSDNGVESYLAEDSVDCNSVPYSLNKKNRWALPEQIRQDILHGDHSGEKFGIQLVERHKLNKQADCIGVCSTKTKLKRKKKGYLDEKSILNAKPAFSRKRRQERIRHGLPAADDESQVHVVEPDQIRYDVLYPCPPTSALTFTNPKFQTPVDENGLRNKGSRQRLRYVVADTIEESLECMDNVFDDSEEEDSYYDDEEEVSHVERTTECLIEDILRHADKANKLVNGATRGKRHGSKSDDRNEDASKSHIIFEDREEKTDTEDAVPTVPAINYADGATAIKTPEIIPVLVILPTEQVDPQNLKFCFGNNFIECDCFPRKFVIDISQTLTDYLPKTNVTKALRAQINACIVFIHDVDNEINNPKESVYRVYLNTNYNSNQQSVKIETIFDYVETNIDEIIQRTLFYIETLPNEAIEFDTQFEHLKKLQNSKYAVEELAQWKADSYKPHEQYLLQTFVNSRNDDHTASELDFEVVSRFDSFYAAEETSNVTSPKDRFCNVCFELLGAGKPGTALISCGHWFCDSCWTEHLRTKVNGGSLTLHCPEYDCEKVVDPGTALTLMKMKNIVKYAKVCHDTKVEQTATTKWCPNERCGRVLKACREDVRIAQCPCGVRVCFQCLGPSHWPAPCEPASLYNEKLVASGHSAMKPFDTMTAVSVYGKCCPTCKRFVEKDGGCPYMECVCGKAFCWGCGKKYSGNNHNGCYQEGARNKHKTVKKHIRQEDQFNKPKGEDWYLEALAHRRKQHPANIKRLNTASKGLSKQIQRHTMKAEQNGEIMTLNFDLSNKIYTNESNKVPDFLRNTIDLYREINHILENAKVLLNAKSSDKVRLNQIKHVIHRLTVLADDIFDMFEHGVGYPSGSSSVKDFVQRLVDVRYYSRLAIHGLVKSIKMAEL